MMIPSKRPSRRGLLKALSLGPAFLPVLPVRETYAQPGSMPKRLLIVFQSGGCVHDAFWPTSTDLNATKLPAVTAPLEPWKSKLLMLDGVVLKHFLDYGDRGAGHENVGSIFSGSRGLTFDDGYGSNRTTPDAATLDQVIAEKLAPSARTPFKGFYLWPQGDRWQGDDRAFLTCPFWRGSKQSIQPEYDATKAMNSLFSGAPSTSAPDPRLEKLKAEKKSLLDYAAGQLQTFAKTQGTDGKLRIDQHLQTMREMEMRIEAPAGGITTSAACARPAAPTWNTKDMLNYPQNVNLHFDLAVAALACDASRVVAVQLHNASGEGLQHPWVGVSGTGIEYKNGRHYHDVQHQPGPMSADKIKVDNWYMQMFAGLLDRLSKIQEGDGTMLDNTAVLWANHMGYNHSSHRLGWILAGSCGGYFKTGRYLKLGANPSQPSGCMPSTRILVALANAVGVPMETFGDPAYGGEFTGLRG